MEALDPNEESLKLRDLGEKAIEYVHRQLTKAGPLSLMLSDRGIHSISAMIPESIDVQAANSFTQGGIGSDRYAWRDPLNELIHQQNSLVVADGWLNGPTDPHLQSKQYFLTASGGVYFFSNPDHCIDGEDLIRWVSPYPSVIIVSSFSRQISPGETLSERETATIAANAKLVLVGAYDEETYIRALLV